MSDFIDNMAIESGCENYSENSATENSSYDGSFINDGSIEQRSWTGSDASPIVKKAKKNDKDSPSSLDGSYDSSFIDDNGEESLHLSENIKSGKTVCICFDIVE